MALPLMVVTMAEAAGGTVSRRDLIAVGISPNTITAWVRQGVLHQTGRGEYRIAGSDPSMRQHLATMLWRAGRGARLAGGLSLGLRGVKGFAPHTDGHVAIPPGRRVRGVEFKVVRTPLPPEDHDTILDLPAVTPERGLVGAAASNRPARIRVAWDDMHFRGIVKMDRLEACLQRLGNAYGAPQMRKIAGVGTLRQESERERDLLGIFRTGDPRPAAQVWVQHRARWHRLDFAFLDVRLALEYDGENHAGRREQDADRDLAMMELRIATIRVTTSLLRDPEDLRRRVLTVYKERSQLALPPLVPQRPAWA